MTTTQTAKVGLISPEVRKNLEALGLQIDKSKQQLALLEELGLGVSDLKARLDWADKRRATLLAKG